MDFLTNITFLDALAYVSYFIAAATLLHNILPPKELVWKYFPKAQWYGFIVDVLTRWASGDLKGKVYDLQKHIGDLELQRREQRQPDQG